MGIEFGMEQVWVLPAIPAALFVVLALLSPLIPRRGDFIAALGMAAVVGLVFLVMLDYTSVFHDGHFSPEGSNVLSFDWVNIGQGFLSSSSRPSWTASPW